MNLPSNVEHARFNMIEQQIRPWDVLDPDVLEILMLVKREKFVPLGHQALAFVDMEIPLLGTAEDALQNGHCMLAPKVEARMLQNLGPKPRERVLEVGAGSGYMAALLACRAQRVITLEIDSALAQLAAANLRQGGVTNAEVRQADGAQGLAGEAPFDVIVLSGSVSHVPPVLLAQLTIGGRLGAIVGFEPIMRATFITRTGQDSYATVQPWDTLAPRLAHFTEPSAFVF